MFPDNLAHPDRKKWRENWRVDGGSAFIAQAVDRISRISLIKVEINCAYIGENEACDYIQFYLQV